MANSTALMIFSLIYLGMTKEATIMMTGAEMNLKRARIGAFVFSKLKLATHSVLFAPKLLP